MTHLQQALLATLDDLQVGDGLLATNLLTRIEIDLGMAFDQKDSNLIDDAFLKHISDSMRKFRPDVETAEFLRIFQNHGGA